MSKKKGNENIISSSSKHQPTLIKNKIFFFEESVLIAFH